MCVCRGYFRNLRWVHDDCWDKVEEDMIAVGSHGCVIESHLQFVHGFKQQTLCLIVKVLERGLLMKEQSKKISINKGSWA